jgi:hypothetical protein
MAATAAAAAAAADLSLVGANVAANVDAVCQKQQHVVSSVTFCIYRYMRTHSHPACHIIK